KDFRQLVRAAQDSQSGDGAALLQWIVVQEADRLVFHLGVLAALAQHHFAAVAGAVDQHGNFFFPGAVDQRSEHAERQASGGDANEQQEAVNNHDNARITVEAVNEDHAGHGKQGATDDRLGDTQQVFDASV